MSTKIYEGSVVLGGEKMSLQELKERFATIRASALRNASNRLLSLVASISAQILDSRALGLSVPIYCGETGAVSASIGYVRQRVMSNFSSVARDDEYDFRYEIVFIPFDGSTSCVCSPRLKRNEPLLLAIPFHSDRKFARTWKLHSLVSDFSYWDNADGPRGISANKWKHRGHIWGSALGPDGYGIPANEGFTMQCVVPGCLPFPSARTVHSSLPSFKTRIDYIVDRLLSNEYVDRLLSNEYDAKFAISGPLALSEHLESYQKWTTTTAGKRAVVRCRKQAMSAVIQHPTLENLTRR